MEQLLLKMARQLDALDEASLMSLWDDYANKVNRFEPTQRWQEAALVLSLIQAKRWKNQLFNYQWSSQVKPHDADAPQKSSFSLERPSMSDVKAKAKRATQFSFEQKTEVKKDEQ